MRTLEVIIDHMIANEIRTQETREHLFQDIRSGRRDVHHACQELFNNERNASSQRVGFLQGHAMAFQMDSEILSRARTFFAGQVTFAQVPNPVVFSAGTNRHSYYAEAHPLTSGVDRSVGRHAKAENHRVTNVLHNTRAAATTDGHVMVNGEGSSEDPHLTMTPGDGSSFMV